MDKESQFKAILQDNADRIYRICCCYVLGILLSRYVEPKHSLAAAVLYDLFFLLLCVMGFYFTYRNWPREKAPLLAEILKIEKALREDTAVA